MGIIAFGAAASLLAGCENPLQGVTQQSTDFASTLQPPSNLTYLTVNAIYTVGTAIQYDTPAIASGAQTTFSVNPALPAGLHLDPSTGIISGTPTAITGAADYTITASNLAGSTTSTISITVNDVIPSNVRFSGGSIVLTKGTAFSGSSTSSGGAITSCVASTSLPAGLTLAVVGGECSISGTPTALSPATTYVITASNTGGTTTSSVMITVNDVPPSNLAFAGAPFVLTVGAAFTSVSTSSGGAITSCTVSTPLPTGLAVAATGGECQISGTPTTPTTAANYVITATNTGGSTTATISVAVNAVPPSNLAFSGAPFTLVQGTAFSVTSTSSGGAITACAATTLPAGLTVTTTGGECKLSGTPTAVTGAANYTITASNSGGSTSATIGIVVNPPAPTISFSGSPYTFIQGSSTGLPIVATTGSSVTSCSAPSPFPAGLSVSLTSGQCEISGTPTVVSGATNYAITASNSIGQTASATISITVNPPPPTISFSTSSYTLTQGSSTGLPIVATTGASVTSCSAPSGLPAGLTASLTGGKCQIGGSPTTASSATAYTITASNSIGQTASATISITVTAAPPVSLAFVTQPSSGTAGTLASFSVTGVSSSGNATALPAGTTCSAQIVSNSSGGIIGGTYQNVASFGGQVAFSAVSITMVGTYTLEATCSGVAGATPQSSSFTLSPGNLNSMAISSNPPPPTSVISGQSFNVVVTGTDVYGNGVNSGSVTVSFTGPTGATLTGGSPAPTFSNGTATFNLDITTPTSGSVTLSFQSGSVSTMSTPITVTTAGPLLGTFTTIPQSAPTYTSLPSNYIESVAYTDSTLYVSTPLGIGVSANNGKTFSVKTASDGLPASDLSIAASGNDVFAWDPEHTLLGLYISQNGGTTFVSSPTFSGDTINSVTVSGNSVYVVWTAFGGSGFPYLSVSTNGGSSFQLLSTPPLNFNSVPFVSSSGNVYIQTNSGLAISANGGAFQAATGVPAAAFIEQVFAQPLVAGGADTIYISYSTSSYPNGNIAISNDGGAVFTPVTSSVLNENQIENFTVAPNGTIYVATFPGTTNSVFDTAGTGGVAVSSNGGETFSMATTTQGLPNDYVTQVQVVQGSVYAATYGGLGVSTNGGTSFSTVSNAPAYISALYPANGGLYVYSDEYYYGEGLQFITGGETQVSSTSSSNLAGPALGDEFAISASGYFVATGPSATSTTTLESCNSSLSGCTAVSGLGSGLVSSALFEDMETVGTNIYVVWSGFYAGTATEDPYGHPLTPSTQIVGLSVSTNGSTFTNTGWFVALPAPGDSVWSVLVGTPKGTLVLAISSLGVYSSTNDGSTFTQLPAFPTALYTALYATDNSTAGGPISIYAMADTPSYTDADTAVSADGGQTIASTYSFAGTNCDIAAISSKIYVACDGSLYYSTDGGSTFSPAPISALDYVPPGYVNQFNVFSLYVYGSGLYLNGGSLVSFDGGNTFSSIWGLPHWNEGASNNPNPIVSGGKIYEMFSTGLDEAIFTTPVPQ